VVLVYDVTKEASLRALELWLAELEQHGLGPGDVPRILVGNKCDEPGQQQVSTAAAQRWADDRYGTKYRYLVLQISRFRDRIRTWNITVMCKGVAGNWYRYGTKKLKYRYFFRCTVSYIKNRYRVHYF